MMQNIVISLLVFGCSALYAQAPAAVAQPNNGATKSVPPTMPSVVYKPQTMPGNDERDEAEHDIDIEMQDHVASDIAEEEQEEAQEAMPAPANGKMPGAIRTTPQEFNADAKRKAAMELVDQGVSYLNSHPIDQAFQAFSQDKRFVKGELYLFVFDDKGICYSHGQERNLTWENLYNLQDTFGVYVVQSLIAKAKEGGGWVTYQWRNATQITYVKEAVKNGKKYIIGCGYFPHSKIDAVVNLVKGAVALFNQIVSEGRPMEQAFSSMSYPLGKFVYGDLYLYALDFNGLQLAHGELPGVIGTNGITYQDATGKFVNQEIIKRLKEVDTGVGIWIDYISKNAPKRAYAEKVKDSKGKFYFISCGYYPTADRDQAEDLVKKGYQYMKMNGKSASAEAFTDKKNMQFRYGDLYLFVYDMKGLCVAHGGDPEYVGTNQYNLQDEDGDFYIQELIKKAQAGGGWLDFKLRNSFEVAYVEKIDLGTEQFVIGCGLYPISKYETMVLLAQSGADYVKTHGPQDAFKTFTKVKDGSFIRGDLNIFVFDTSGICYVSGDDYDLIWRNLMNINDDDGKPFVKIMINTVKRGPGTVTFKLNGALKTAYVQPVDMNGTHFMVGSSFYH